MSLELQYKVESQSREDLGAKYKEPVSWPVLKHFVEDLKRLGRKSGAGFYDYPGRRQEEALGRPARRVSAAREAAVASRS